EFRQRANAPQRVGPLRAPVAQILPSRSDALVVLPVTQADRQPQISRLHEKSYPSNVQVQSFPVAKKAYAQLRGTMVGTSEGRRKRGKIRLAGTISRDVMRVYECKVGCCPIEGQANYFRGCYISTSKM